MKAELDELNRSLLERLAASQGDLLSDKALLSSLDETKASAMRIAEALQSATDLQACPPCFFCTTLWLGACV